MGTNLQGGLPSGSYLFRILASFIGLVSISLATTVAQRRYGTPQEIDVTSLVLFLLPFFAMGFGCDFLAKKHKGRRLPWLLLIGSSLLPSFVTYQAWLRSAAALEAQAWTAAALSLGLGWMLVVVVGGLSLAISLSVGAILFKADQRQ